MEEKMKDKIETKAFKFSLKSISEFGDFEGYLAVFNNIDLGNDRIKPGAFEKSLGEKKIFPLFYCHQSISDLPVGDFSAEEDDRGLKVRGRLYLNDAEGLAIERPRQLHVALKRRAVTGLSIGYKTIKDKIENGVRDLLEVRLDEGSVVPWPMNELAVVTEVKRMDGGQELKPYPNEHSARLRDPDDFDSDTFRRVSDGHIYGKKKVPETVDVIWGKLKGHAAPSDQPIPQALRFPTKDWTAAEAKKWLKDNNVDYTLFEPASKSVEGAVETIRELADLTGEAKPAILEAIDSLMALYDRHEPPEGTLVEPGVAPPADSGEEEKILDAARDLSETLRVLILK
jgi:HK97 family phage prohead protease